jgi:hypothetical protein
MHFGMQKLASFKCKFNFLAIKIEIFCCLKRVFKHQRFSLYDGIDEILFEKSLAKNFL